MKENYRGMIILLISFVLSFVLNLNAILYGKAQIIGAIASVLYVFSWLYWAMAYENKREKIFLFVWQIAALVCSFFVMLFLDKGSNYLIIPSIVFLTSLAGLQYFSLLVPLVQILLSLFLFVISFSRSVRARAGQF
ncbi:MAG: hypothetical protein Q4C64_01710 [Erysipelotrichia bacterium]|nr:hypothetical protein [Erysipelotrichia bacterium]